METGKPSSKFDEFDKKPKKKFLTFSNLMLFIPIFIIIWVIAKALTGI